MHRRRVLAAVGAGVVPLAGCSGDSNPTTTPKPRRPTIRVEADSDDWLRGVSLDVEVMSEFTPSNPAEIRVALTNEADESKRLSFGATPPFADLWATDSGGDARTVLYPENSERVSGRHGVVPETTEDGCWRAEDDLIRQAIATTRLVGAGATLERTYVVLAGRDPEGETRPDEDAGSDCLHAGRYRFQMDDYLDTGRPWGFALVLD